MEIVKFDRVVSVNSESKNHPAQTLIDSEVSSQKSWQCEKGAEKAIIILQLERSAVISSVHIGNAHSAFIEVLVGLASDDSNQFQSLIATSTLMPLKDSKLSQSPNRVRIFNKEDLITEVASKSWDRVKVVCAQPYNKQVSYGLCFIRVHGEVKTKTDRIVDLTPKDSSKKEDIPIGSYFAKRKESPVAAETRPKTIVEQIKESESSSKTLTHTPLSKEKITNKMSEKKKKTEERKNIERESDKKNKDNRKNKDYGLEELSPPRETTRKEKEFCNLLGDVRFVISGFKNPLRSDLRSKAIAMGAKYQADWSDSSTHLVCAFVNTPKFHQVKGKGKIVSIDWINNCYNKRKRFPWRRYALDKNDKDEPESEEEIEEKQVASSSSTSRHDKAERTKESTSRDKRSEKDASKEKKHEDKNVKGKKPEERETSTKKYPKKDEIKKRTPDIEITNEDSSKKQKTDNFVEYDVSTDEDEPQVVDTTDYPMPFLLDVFRLNTFYVEHDTEDRGLLERYIVAYNGKLSCSLNSEVKYHITSKSGSQLLDAQKNAPDVKAVEPKWIWEINEQQKWISPDNYSIKQ